MKTNFKNEQTPLTSINAVVTIKKKFGSPEEGEMMKRRVEEADRETPRQTRPSVYTPYNYILYIISLVLHKIIIHYNFIEM